MILIAISLIAILIIMYLAYLKFNKIKDSVWKPVLNLLP